jgi:DNA mismatch endonuclease (patch repair protein)
MADTLTKEQRSFNMSRIRDKNTKPEIIIRSMIHKMGFRFRLHDKTLPGKPDIVLPRHKKIIFIHGCFWHLHNCRYGRVKPKTNADFWQAKRLSNKIRDKKNLVELKKLGWQILVVWECQIKKMPILMQKVNEFLS